MLVNKIKESNKNTINQCTCNSVSSTTTKNVLLRLVSISCIIQSLVLFTFVTYVIIGTVHTTYSKILRVGPNLLTKFAVILYLNYMALLTLLSVFENHNTSKESKPFILSLERYKKNIFAV